MGILKKFIGKFRITIFSFRISLWNRFLGWNVHFVCGKDISLGTGLDIRLRKNSTVHLDDRCSIGNGSVLDCAENASIILGKNVVLFKNIVIAARERIEIGDDCLIGEFSSIRDFNHSFEDIHIPIAHQGYTSEPVIIDSDVWVGRGVAVLKGVKIGKHAVIGANSVVTKDIPGGVVAVGVPARIIKKL
jgi:acetyltransferase-like isoleucine patch superfamily enzyme